MSVVFVGLHDVTFIFYTVTTYKAAVFDFEPVYMSDDSRVLSRPDAIVFMTKTLDIFEEQCKQAHSKVRMTSVGMR